MINIQVKGLSDGLGMVGKQTLFAAAVALTRTAGAVEKELVKDFISELDNPSPYTRRSTFRTSATKSNLSAMVGIKDRKPAGGTAPAVLLKEHFTGGVRGNKPMEKALAALGAMPAGWRVVPGAGMPLNAYGNPKLAAVREVIGALRSKTQIYKGRGKRMTMVGYFVIPVGSSRSSLHPGIYMRTARTLKPMFLFVKAAGYRMRFDLPGMAQRVASTEFPLQFDAAFTSAMATAR